MTGTGIRLQEFGRFVTAIFALIALGTCLGAAQTSTATILGTVKDTTGALIPGVSITVKHTESGLTRNVVSGERGGYTVPLLPVGAYEITTTMPGFKQEVRTGINLVVGQEAVVDLTLEVGAAAEQVTVTEEAPLVNTSSLRRTEPATNCSAWKRCGNSTFWATPTAPNMGNEPEDKSAL